jgi:membrane-associated protease RseP (regulator of RpoE activity)
VTRRLPQRAATSALLACLSLFAACTSYSYETRIPNERFEVARAQVGNGVTESLFVDARLEATMEAVVETDRERPSLGLQVRELDREGAERRGVTPYSGLLVTGTQADSAARAAGVVPGDIILSVGGQKTVYQNLLSSVESSLASGVATTLRVLRGQQEIDVQATPKAKREREITKKSIALDSVDSARPYAGLVLRGLPEDLCDRVLGEGKNGVLVMSVEVGSPAWLAGFRCGDFVELVDGTPTPPAQQLAATIYERGVQGGSIAMTVRRGTSAQHSATIELRDYTTTKKVWVPFVYYREQGVPKTCWTTGPLGILASSNTTYVSDARGREAETHDTFRALLSLIRYDSSTRGDCLRLLWFIHIDM